MCNNEAEPLYYHCPGLCDHLVKPENIIDAAPHTEKQQGSVFPSQTYFTAF